MPVIKDYILVINAGSSSLKVKIFQPESFGLAVSAIMEKIGQPGSFLQIEESRTNRRMLMKNYPEGVANTPLALNIILNHLKHWQAKIGVIGHRVVHGGQAFTKPTLVTPEILERLKAFNQLAPLHQPINLAVIEFCLKNFPALNNVAVFDTAFYKHIPPYAYLYAIPYQYYTQYGIRRYGFHGISHQHAALIAAAELKKPLKKLKLITCHLGAGDSVAAVKFGQAIECSMGFTPLEGLTMSTRSGDLDPAVAFYLMRRLNLSASEVEKILNEKSGLLGIFGFSQDLRDVLVAAGYKVSGYQAAKKFNAQEKKQAILALKMYIYDIVRYIGSYQMILGGVDAIVFTGAVGENSSIIRNLIMKEVKKILKTVKVLAVPAGEELMIARAAVKLIG